MANRYPKALTELEPEEASFRQSVRRFAEQEVRPLTRVMEAEARIPPSLLAQFFRLGLMGIEIPEALGGSGARMMEVVLAVEELSRVDASVAVMVDVQNTLVNAILQRWGSPELQARHLPELAQESIGSFALSESGSGSDAFALQTRAERRDGAWVLQGRKLWVSSGREAGFFLVFASTDPSKGRKGITAFAVARQSEGLAVGMSERKLGIRASSTTELILDQCRVPGDHLIGEPGSGYRIAIEALNAGRIGIAAQMVGVAQGALDATLPYLQERRQFGKRLSEFQGIQFQVAQAAAELEGARLLVYNAARLKDGGAPFAQQAAMAKLIASQVAERVTSLCVELFGGYGYTEDYPVEKYYRDAKIGAIYEGTTNMQLTTIAKGLGLRSTP
jgi:alkylation response protein AidB-like acyl-CoA dehydrogenase